MKFLAFALCLAAVASAQRPPAPRVSADPLPAEQLAVYTDFLTHYNNGSKTTLNVADTLELFRPGSGESCLADFGSIPAGDTVHRVPAELASAGKIKLVDPTTHRKRDPGEAIRKGEPVDSAVAAGFANGIFSFSEIAFDPAHKLAAFSYSFVCGGLCGHGGVVIYELHDGHWTASTKRQCGSWIS